MAQTSTDTVDFGRVFSDAFGALRQNWGPYLILAPIFAGIPAAAATWEVEQLIAQHVLSTTNPVGGLLIGYLRSLPVSIAGYVLQGAVMVGAAAYFTGRRASFSDCLIAGLRNWPALLLLNLMRGVATDVGYLFFIVPGVILNLAWYVAGPVQVLERGSPLSSLRRSAELTRGRRWSIFGLSIIVGVFGLVIGLVAGFIGGFVVGFMRPFGAHGLQPNVLIYPLTYMAALPFGSAVVAALYQQLTQGQSQTEALAEVFA